MRENVIVFASPLYSCGKQMCAVKIPRGNVSNRATVKLL